MEPRQKDLTSIFEDDDKTEREAALLDSIGERIGPSRIKHFEPIASHLPERAEALRTGARKPCEWQSPAGMRPRPLFLLQRAEEAQVMALLPEGPPKRFRWRGMTHGVLHSEGPERIADEWWRNPEPKPDRDYYFVEDERGRRFWIYREGVSDESSAPRWFVHGLFG